MDRSVPVGLLQRSFEQRRLDDLTLAGLQLVHVRGRDPGDGKDPGIDVGDRVSGLDGRSPGLAGDRHQAGESLRDQIEATAVGERSVAPVAGHRAVDEARIHLRQHVVAETELLQRSAAIVLRQHIGLLDEAQQDLRALRMLQVDRDAALVAVEHQERRRDPVYPRLAVASRVVAARDLLHLHDVGAHVREHHPARGTRHDLRELEHAHAGERARVCGVRRVSSPDPSRHRPMNSGLRFARNAA